MEFTFVLDGMTLKSEDKYFVDKYGNRYMKFSDGNGNNFKVRRDDLIINLETGECKSRLKEINLVKI
jgi:hypothetical protein